MFWLSLIALTALAAYVVPRVLDQSQEQGYREIEGQGRPPLAETISGSVSTQFPVRPFLDEISAPERQIFPSDDRSPEAEATGGPGLPQRDVPLTNPTSSSSSSARDPVTSRAWVVRDCSVYESPRTTARALGTVAPGTQVRWVKSTDSGWEEILLRDGRSVYMQAGSLSFSEVAGQPTSGSRTPRADEVENFISLLPATVDSFLLTLREGDLLRANTYLAQSAPALEEPHLSVWSGLIGSGSTGRVGRIEPISGRNEEWRSVLVIDEGAGGAQVFTTWQWDSRQDRWLLSGWE